MGKKLQVVKSYTKKNGSKVRAHRRRSPKK